MCGKVRWECVYLYGLLLMCFGCLSTAIIGNGGLVVSGVLVGGLGGGDAG